MKHLGTKTLETNRLILRKFIIDDYEYAYSNWMSDDKVTKYLTWSTHPNKELSKEIITSWINEYPNNNYYQWVICIKDNNIPIGSISIVDINEEKEELEIGYCLSSKYWSQGVMTEALSEVIRFFQKEIKVKKLIAKYDSRNIASGKVMLKCGMKFIEKEKSINKGENIIIHVYEIE